LRRLSQKSFSERCTEVRARFEAERCGSRL